MLKVSIFSLYVIESNAKFFKCNSVDLSALDVATKYL